MNIIGYLKKYGERSFADFPFNDVDALILSELCYVNFDWACPLLEDIDKPFPRFGALKVDNPRDFYYGSVDALRNERLLNKMRKSRRYKNTRVGAAQNIFLEEENQQFFAMAFLLDDGTAFLAFRGTDVTLCGWHENFAMTYSPFIPSQQQALEYLQSFASSFSCPLRLGGHSKGGNLAFYAALAAGETIQQRILNAYSFDGPGFQIMPVEDAICVKMLPKMRKFVTKRDAIGVIYGTIKPVKIVRSRGLLFGGHDAFTWRIDKNLGDFKTAPKRSKGSLRTEKRMAHWLKKTSPADKKLITKFLFEAFKTADVVYDLPFVLLFSLVHMPFVLRRYPKDERRRIKKLLRTLVHVFLPVFGKKA